MMQTLEMRVELGVEIIRDIPQDVVRHIANLHIKGRLSELEKLGSGSYGNVYGFGDYAIKSLYDLDSYGSNDVNVLKDISHLEAIPNLYAVIDEKLIIVDKVKGKTVRSYVNNYGNRNPYNVGNHTVEQWEEALKDIVKLGYSPHDLHASNVMVDENGNVKIVDVGFFKKHGNIIDDTYNFRHDNGYDNAQDWAGRSLKNFVRDVEDRKALAI